MNPLDLLTVAVLAFVGFRLADAARQTFSSRRHVWTLVTGLRPRHFLGAVPVLAGVAAFAVVFLSIPGLDFGWWTKLGGTGNPVIGVGRKSATPGATATIVPVVFVTLLIIGLPLLVEAEEWVFRRGAQHRGRAANARRSILFGLVHALVGIPIGVAMALSVGGFYFTWAYLRQWRRTGSEDAALAESTRSHLAYDLVIAAIVVFALATGSV
jgi:membrane protease YdiL (CAAX protease family)